MSLLHHQLLLANAASGVSYVTFDPTRPGMSGRVTLSNGNRTAVLTSNGSTSFGTAALTHAIPWNDAVGRYLEFQFNRIGGDVIGLGPASAGSSLNASLGYLGESATQFSLWQDGTVDFAGSLTLHSPLDDWHLVSVGMKFYELNGKLWIGKIGTTGWWNPPSNNYTGDPLTGVGNVLDNFGSAAFSLAVSTVSRAEVTVCSDPATWLDTPPTGSVPFTN